MRSHLCDSLRVDHIGQRVCLAGWVNSYRDHGGVIFIDLRDREGLTQGVFHPEHAQAQELADSLRNEDVINVVGKCIRREAGMANPKLATGEIDLPVMNGRELHEALRDAQSQSGPTDA